MEAGQSVRLVDHFTVESSPLNSLSPAQAEAALRAEKIFTEDFADFSASKAGWSVHAVKIVARPGHGSALQYRGGGRQLGFVVPIAPHTVYRVRRAVRVADARQAKVDLKVAETNVTLVHPRQANHPVDRERVWTGRFVAAKNLLYVHRFSRAAERLGQWSTDEVRFTSGTDAHSLLIYIADAEGSIAGTGRETYFDDIVVERLKLGHAAKLAAYAQRWRHAGDSSSWRKHGQLLPVPRLKAVGAGTPLESNFDHRAALFAPPPTTIRFNLSLQPSTAPRLDYSIALLGDSTPGSRMRFVVEVDGTTVASDELVMARGGGLPQWQRRRVVLPSNGRGLLRLKTTGDAGAYGVWGNPVVVPHLRAARRPNIVIIAVDTLRADRLGVYGGAAGVSPHIDRLARQGVRFERAISASNWTTSAFASLFTGLMPSRHGVIHRSRALAAEHKTLAEYLQGAGYVTQGIAYKAYLYDMGFEQGFDEWFNVPRSDITARHNMARAKAFFDRVGDQSFFLFFHLNDPHQPMNHSREFIDRFVPVATQRKLGMRFPMTIGLKNNVIGCSRCASGGKLAPGFKEVGRSLYDSAVAFTDHHIGALLRELKARQLYDNTIIVLVADHGEVMWDRGNYFGHGGTYLSDEAVRVPLIIKGASGAAALPVGSTVQAQVRAFDLMPTLLRLAQVPFIAATMEAQDLEPLWQSEQPSRLAVSENIKQHVTMVSDGRWKLDIRHTPGRSPRARLYDLADDPGERRDVTEKFTAVHARLEREFIRYWLSHRPGRYLVGRPLATESGTALDRPKGAPLPQALVGGARASGGGVRLVPGPSRVVFARLEGSSVWRRRDGQKLAYNTLPITEEADATIGRAWSAEIQAAATALIDGPLVEVVVGDGAPSAEDNRAGISADQLATLRAQGYIQ